MRVKIALVSINVRDRFRETERSTVLGQLLEVTYHLKWSLFDEMAVPVGDH